MGWVSRVRSVALLVQMVPLKAQTQAGAVVVVVMVTSDHG
jgi:hypothetical protein